VGADSVLNLLLAISADPSKAEQAIKQFEQTTGNSFSALAKAPKEFEDSLLSSRESARLLTEEMGIRLPRAVTGAVAEVLPALSALGPALLGVFAVTEIPKMVSGIREALQSWEGFGKAEQEAMKRAIEDTGRLHEQVINVEKELDLFGKSQAAQAALRAQWAGEDAQRALKQLLDAEKEVEGIKGQIASAREAMKAVGSDAAVFGAKYESALEVATANVNKLREAWKLADEQALLAQKRAAEAAKEQADPAARDAARHLVLRNTNKLTYIEN